MDLLIGPVTPFINVSHETEFKTISKLCALPRRQEYNVFISNSHITDFGLIRGTEILLDELFISFNIKRVFCVKENDNRVLKEFCSYYRVTCYEI